MNETVNGRDQLSFIANLFNVNNIITAITRLRDENICARKIIGEEKSLLEDGVGIMIISQQDFATVLACDFSNRSFFLSI